jgi:radical SAM protein with 4Fe4S-binding SPASM domain
MAASIDICVEPKGDVYPCQSYFKGLGSILRDDSYEIWNNSFAVKIRERGYAEPIGKTALNCNRVEAVVHWNSKTKTTCVLSPDQNSSRGVCPGFFFSSTRVSAGGSFS